MSTIEVKVPDIGDFKDIPVIEVFVKVGDTVKAEDSLLTLESDKATMDVPSPAAGVVREMKLKRGDKASEGTLILVLETAGAAATSVAPAAPATPATQTPPAAPARPEATLCDSSVIHHPRRNAALARSLSCWCCSSSWRWWRCTPAAT